MTRGDLARLVLKRRRIRTSFEAWCEHALAPYGQTPAKHHRLIIRELQAIEDGTNDRLILMLPPGSAKSTYASKLFPPHFLARHPGSLVIGASHGQGLADTFSGDCQRFIRENTKTLGYGLENKAVDLWKTTNKGVYRAVGTEGSVTGRRANLIIWDDPLRGQLDADSPTMRDKIWNWYRSDVYTRLLPGGAIVVIMTRFHEDDICGRLLAEMAAGGDQWRVISLPAIAESNDPLGRKPGEALWPEWENLDALARKRRVLGERAFASLFQQQPRPAEGAIIKSGWWKPWTEKLPTPDMTLVSLDLAYTDKDQNDPSACTVWDVIPGDNYRSKAVLVHAWAERLEFPALMERVIATAKQAHTKDVPLRVLIEAKASGLSVIQELRRRVPSLNIHSVVPKGDKVARAHAVTAMFEGGVVHAHATKADGQEPVFAAWAQAVIDECAAFPMGAHDDRVDSVTMALRHIRDLGVELFAEDEGPAPSLVEAAPFY